MVYSLGIELNGVFGFDLLAKIAGPAQLISVVNEYRLFEEKSLVPPSPGTSSSNPWSAGWKHEDNPDLDKFGSDTFFNPLADKLKLAMYKKSLSQLEAGGTGETIEMEVIKKKKTTH